jgi:hypothetical protein
VVGVVVVVVGVVVVPVDFTVVVVVGVVAVVVVVVAVLYASNSSSVFVVGVSGVTFTGSKAMDTRI